MTEFKRESIRAFRFVNAGSSGGGWRSVRGRKAARPPRFCT